MFYASKALTILWRLTGLGTLSLSSSPPPSSSRLSVVYAATVYSAFAYLCFVLASERLSAYGRHESGTFQIHAIRDTNMALLFVASTVVYWCTHVYRRQHVRVYAEHAAVVHQLFGTAAPVGRDMNAYCWVLYASLVAALSLDVRRYVGPMPWTFGAVYVWGHYVLLTGNIQFAITVFGLRQCYRELNCRMRAGSSGRSHDSGLREYGTTVAKTSSSDVQLQNIMFISVLEKVNLLTILKYWSDVHWSITQIVSRVNNLFKFRLFVFFLCGLLHLMLTPYLLSLTILNEDIDILRYILECTLWFIIHILRVVLMIYPCALLGEEAAKTQILLGSYLNTKIDLFDIKKIETYAQQLAANTPEFSIYSMFIIDKQLVVTLTGAVTTYLVIILQLQGQS
ncbi:gustatory receptor for sugar taste 43a-like [Rhopalosiphum maidis]|uniref:gustatory receptor for sugar taste 43a-like n=1 Tax=Rhopalosiphum maidis TaxID=43146 RepID=UPI000EFF2F6E|nr:gustatory receptor for sugar taste 43a-like [Rhopalosiphum maidis]